MSENTSAIADFLRGQPGNTASLAALHKQFGLTAPLAGLESFLIRPKDDWMKLEDRTWLRLPGSNARTALNIAMTVTRIPDEWWEPLLDLCGEQKRLGVREAATARSKVLARSYLAEQAAAELDVEMERIQPLIRAGRISSFVDPAGRTRIPAEAVNDLKADPATLKGLLGPDYIELRDLADFFNVSPFSIGERLGNGMRKPGGRVLWPMAVRKLWRPGEAPSLESFRERLAARRLSFDADQRRRGERQQRKAQSRAERHRAQVEEERRERDALRAQLLAAFPTWRHGRREY